MRKTLTLLAVIVLVVAIVAVLQKVAIVRNERRGLVVVVAVVVRGRIGSVSFPVVLCL